MPNNRLPQQTSYRVAILGHRGVPNSYGGFETLAEELSACLVGLGSEVTVYCRKNYFASRPETYRGSRLVYLPTIKHKVLDTPFHTFISAIHVLLKNSADVVVMVMVGNAPFAGLLKLFGKKVIFCVDGLDWERKKWGTLARWYLKACSYLARFVSHQIVTDAQSVQNFYQESRHAKSALIPYGTEIEVLNNDRATILNQYGLTAKQYFIYVARFEPENNPLLVVKSYVASGSACPLVMIGDNRYDPALVEEIKRAANDRVLFLGYVFGSRYKQLLRNALAYVRAAEVGGASPAVIEAMGRGVCVIANEKPENREVLRDTGRFYELNQDGLTAAFREITAHPKKAEQLGERAAQRAMLVYNWDKIGHEYFKLMQKVAAQPSAANVPLTSEAGGNSPRILMTGAGGMLGQALYQHFLRHYTVMATDIDCNEPWLTYLDVRDQDAYRGAVEKFQPDYVFHLAAMTDLEECEKNFANAYAVNALSAKYGAQTASRYGAKFVYISSAGVFDGRQDWYRDDDEPTPLNVYALTKQMGALMTEFYARHYLIIRPGWMMGGGPVKDKKFVNKIVSQILSGQKEIRAVTDKLGTPTYTHALAANLDTLLAGETEGAYNVVCNGSASRFAIAKEIVRILGYQDIIKVIPVTSDYFADTYFAARPRSENLLNDRLNREGKNRMPNWQTALHDYLRRDFAYAFNAPEEKSGLQYFSVNPLESV